MLHVRYDWRRRVAWSVFCVALFLTSQDSITRTVDLQDDSLSEQARNQEIILKKADFVHAGFISYEGFMIKK